jgi:transposase
MDCEQANELLRTIRDRRSRVLLARIHKEATRLRQLRVCTPKSKLGQALMYLKNQRLPLEVFLDDPAVPIDNNASERALRHVVLGRRNWQVAGSARGAEVAANLYSLICTCRAMDLNPERYLADVLVAVSTTPSSEIASLTPWAWAQSHPEIKLS